MVKSMEVLIATTIFLSKNDAGIPCALDLSWKLDAGWKWWWKMVMNTMVESVKNHHCNKKQIQDEGYNPSYPFIFGHL